MNEMKSNVLRDKLDAQSSQFGMDFKQQFESIETWAYEDWVPTLSHDRGSHNGPSHLKGVEQQVCDLVRRIEGVDFSAAESFILLCAILFHDVGKCDLKGELNKIKMLRFNSLIIDNKLKKKKNKHALFSADMIYHLAYRFGFRDTGIAECVAVVCLSHDPDYADFLKKTNQLEDRFLDRYGKIRVSWLAALLSLGDELDNSYHRSFQIEKKSKKSNSKKSIEPIKGMQRSKISGCEVDLKGRLLIVHPFYEVIECFQKGKLDECLYLVAMDMNKMRRLIDIWFRPLRQMEIEINEIAMSLNGHLVRIGKTKLSKKSLGLNIVKSNVFQLTAEPTLCLMKLDRILDSAIQLRFNNFGKSQFPWETLGSEAGIENIDELKLIYHRLQMLAQIYFKSDNKTDRLLDKLKVIGKAKGDLEVKVVFIELDGEWSIRFEPNIDKNELEEKSKYAIREFYIWVCNMLNPNIKTKKTEQKSNEIQYKIRNPELAYLLNEKIGIDDNKKNNDDPFRTCFHFPESKSILHQYLPGSAVGINLVITGPPGVGKSTLAMEFIAQGKLEVADEGSTSLNAYFSLEQPEETISQLARDMGIKETSLINYFPNSQFFEDHTGKESNDNLLRSLQCKCQYGEPCLLLPKLAPRSFGDVVDEERLYWFRYKQVARLLEAKHANNLICPPDQSKLVLSTVVFDNLNAFSRHPLIRQRIHQFFKLISWGGVLGIHIIENSTDATTEFQSIVEFLADIVIRLDWINEDYRYKVLEVVKSRSQRHVLGAHPFKIKRQGDRTDLNYPSFEIYPSVHAQISRVEKKIPAQQDKENDSNKHNGGNGQITDVTTSGSIFAVNGLLNKLVHKNWDNKWIQRNGDTITIDYENASKQSGIGQDAFIVLNGRSGGHKLVIGMNYIHGKKPDESALVINMGQPIEYFSVAGRREWWSDLAIIRDKHGCEHLSWVGSDKVRVDVYGLQTSGIKNNKLDKPISGGAVYVLNFHTGFLLLEEFLYIVNSFIEFVGKVSKISRILFSSTAHLPERFPMLDKDPLTLTALVRILKQKKIGLMVIAVNGVGRAERIESLSSVADLKVTVLNFNDENLYSWMKDKIEKEGSGVRVISSDNVTGKDYKKRYSILRIKPCAEKDNLGDVIELINLPNSYRENRRKS